MTADTATQVGHVRRPIAKERPEPVVRTVIRRDATGAELGEVELEPSIFGIEPNQAVLHQVITAQLAAARSGTQSTKTRAQVRGGGAKPYRQKGTGRARQGSTRAAQWSGGGVAMGPHPRSYRQRTPKKMVRLALCSALSDRAALDKVALVDRWGFEAPKTKDAVAALAALGLEGKVLVVVAPEDTVARRSFANLPDVQAISATELAAYDILRNDWIVFDDATLPGRYEFTETVIESVDEETGDVAIEIVDEVIDTITGDEAASVTEITIDGATGETVVEVTEEIIDGETGEVLIVDEVDEAIDDDEGDDEGDELDVVPEAKATPVEAPDDEETPDA